MKKPKKPRKIPAYICFVGDKNPKTPVDVRGMKLVDNDGSIYVIEYDEKSDFLFAVVNNKQLPVEFDYE